MSTEDFTSYTENDAGGYLTIDDADSLHVTNLPDNATCLLYKDKGAGHFGDFEHLFEVKSTQNNLGSYWGLHLLGNEPNVNRVSYSSDYVECYEQRQANLRLTIHSKDFGITDTYDYYVNTNNVWYYCTYKRLGLVLTLKIYQDQTRLILLDTLTVACVNTTFRYIYATTSNDGGAGTILNNGYLDKLDLQEVTPTSTDKNIPTYFNSKFITHH